MEFYLIPPFPNTASVPFKYAVTCNDHATSIKFPKEYDHDLKFHTFLVLELIGSGGSSAHEDVRRVKMPIKDGLSRLGVQSGSSTQRNAEQLTAAPMQFNFTQSVVAV
jgi:hypothetical protein